MLEKISSPRDLREISIDGLEQLAAELRSKIINTVSRTGGHLASSLCAVDLIVALHKVFNTPQEKIFFDVGHQAYAHKLLTGRREGFERLRAIDGISGFPHPDESPYDPAVAGHAGSALSCALGCACADPEAPDKVIAVVGDGALTCGITLEAMNCTAASQGAKKLIVILNDNQMSISHNVGALTAYLNKLRSTSAYNKFRNQMKWLLHRTPRISNFFKRIDDLAKNIFMPPATIFEALGFRYFGPVNGHNIKQLTGILNTLRTLDGPILLHISTIKGFGCDFAMKEPTRYHGIAGCDVNNGTLPPSSPGFSHAFGAAIIKAAEKDPDLVAISAAMIEGTGLADFAGRFPERIFDAGIAEEHAVTFAAGLALAGKHPICAMYDTFLQRAADCVYHDIVLAQLPVVIIADRAGAVEDGPTHHGIYSCGFFRALPGLTILSPASCSEVENYLEFALSLRHPVLIRYPRGEGADISAPEPLRYGKAAIIRNPSAASAVIWSSGAELKTALECADILKKNHNLTLAVADCRFLAPFDAELARSFGKIHHFTIEDHAICGGLGSALLEALDNGVPITRFGWGNSVIPHGKPRDLRIKYHLTAGDIAAAIAAKLQ